MVNLDLGSRRLRAFTSLSMTLLPCFLEGYEGVWMSRFEEVEQMAVTEPDVRSRD